MAKPANRKFQSWTTEALQKEAKRIGLHSQAKMDRKELISWLREAYGL